MCFLKVRKYHRKIPVLESVFNKACNFVTKILQHRCFRVEFAKFLRIPILKIWRTSANYCFYTFIRTHHHLHFHHFHYHQKQPFADVIQNRCSQKFRKFHRKTPALKSLFNKVADLASATLIKGDTNTSFCLWNLRNF